MNHTYIIGEIGQNHNGSVDIAKLIVDLISRPVYEELSNVNLKPMDAVKLVKRDLKEEFSESMRIAPYDSPHSFGKTYGEHREFLELDYNEHLEIFNHAKSKGLDVIETLCSIGTIELLKYFLPDRIKIASRDLTNLPLLEALSETQIPLILSTGMAGKKELDDALEIIVKQHDKISIMHCVSEYPTKPQNVNLLSIKYLLNNYSQYVIGFSDHTIGISAPVAAVAIGAQIIEKHVTIDRRMKGSDQAGSLGPDGVNRLIRDIRITEISLGKVDIYIEPSIENTRIKLERSIAAKRDISAGEIICVDDLHLLSPGDGYKWKELGKVINKKVLIPIKKNEIIYSEFLSDIN